MTPKSTVECAATLISAPASGQGKTTLTAALARRLVNAGKRVQIFKLGPDYLDPTVLELAARQPVYNLDLWIMGENHCRQLLFRAAASNDVIFVEGLMGLHDGDPSNAVVASLFELPVTLIMDVAKFAQTSAAIVHGMMHYAPGLDIQGVVGNRVGSDNHHRLVAESIASRLPYYGSVRRHDEMVLPQRHLGLVQAGEIEQLDQILDGAAACLDTFGVEVDLSPVSFHPTEGKESKAPTSLRGVRIAIARDNAFGFVYPENVNVLRNMGALVEFFSPLANEAPPPCDALWLPGGYPELHLDALQAASCTRDAIRAHCAVGKPVLAECGGMMYLGTSITDMSGNSATMCGVFDGDSTMLGRFQSIGLQSLQCPSGAIRGHAFHHSRLTTSLEPAQYANKQNGGRGAAVYRLGNIQFSYLHLYFASNPAGAAALFR